MEKLCGIQTKKKIQNTKEKFFSERWLKGSRRRGRDEVGSLAGWGNGLVVRQKSFWDQSTLRRRGVGVPEKLLKLGRHHTRTPRIVQASSAQDVLRGGRQDPSQDKGTSDTALWRSTSAWTTGPHS